MTVDKVTLNPESFNENITFALSGTDYSNFEISSTENVVTISIKSGVLTEEMMQKTLYVFNVDALEHGTVIASTNIMITTQEAKAPKFDKNFYTGTVNHTLRHETIRVDENDLEVSLSDSTFFEISVSGNIVTVNLKAGAVIPEEKKSFVITLYAKNPTKNKMAESVLFITVESEYEEKLEFTNIIYEGQISKILSLTHEPITLNNETFTITVSGKDSNFVRATKNGFSVRLTLDNLEDFPKDVSYLQIILTATAENFSPAQSIVILGIERENSTEIDLAQPYFEIGFYSFSILKIQTGIIGAVRAFVPDESLPGYALLFDDDSLIGKLTIASGNLIVNEAISPGIYNMRAFALNAGKNATAKVTLRVFETFCNGDTHVDKTLAIKHLAENGIYNDIMYSKINDCEYEIYSVFPANLRCE